MFRKKCSLSPFFLRGFLLLFLLTLAQAGLFSQPLPAKTNHSIIIDTDCAIDDMRAISLLLDRPEISIKAILISDGSLAAADGAEKVKALLHEFNRDSIPIACGPGLPDVNPPWRDFNKKLPWGKKPGSSSSPAAAFDCLSSVLNSSDEKITLVCLGALTNMAQLIQQEPELLKKTDRTIWYNESIDPLKGFNFLCDTVSAKIVLNSGNRIDVISNLGKEASLFNSSLLDVCRHSGTRLAKQFVMVHTQQEAYRRLSQNHFRLCDDLVAMYLTNPELFDMNVRMKNISIRYCEDYSVPAVRAALEDMINGVYVSERNVVFRQFPKQAELFSYDVRLIMDTAIVRYGKEEWKANVMTDEFHGHLGVFSIVGAKMGIRAREYFGVGPDLLSAVSFAGSRPPYSCLNDGIQVSTGATLGMGTIRLAEDAKTIPSAIFTYKGRSIQLSLKDEYLKMVNDDIDEGIRKYGLMDEGYWKLIRRNALRYWVEWDRNKIFDIRVPAN